MKIRNYRVRGILKLESRARMFSTVVQANSIKTAESSVRSLVENYCRTKYPDREMIKCIINKKTVRCD